MALAAAAVVYSAPADPAPQGTDVSRADTGMHRGLDEILDVYVRDGLVYYRALRSERGRLDRYIASLNVPEASLARQSRDEQVAYWLNAYNAFVLKTVIDNYPIRGTSSAYPSNSIRQVPGAFDRISHAAAGRTVTLDQIEKVILPEFRDPRVYFSLGRGAVGSGRLRSEAFSGARLETQLEQATAEIVTRAALLQVDPTQRLVTVTPIVGWHEEEFVAAFAGAAAAPFAQRSPIERALLALVEPHLFPSERQFLRQNDFTVRYHEFDWRLNDLTGGPPP